MTRTLTGCILAATLLAFLPPAAQADPPVVRIAAIRVSAPSSADVQIRRALDALDKAFTAKGWRVDIRRLKTDAVGRCVREHSVDIFVASGGLYRSLLQTGARDIATLFDPRSQSPNEGIGSNFIVRADRTDLKTIDDLIGKRLAASFPNAFTGYHYALGELAERHYDPEKFFTKTLFTFPASNIIDAVIEGKVDAGVLVTCFREEMEARGDPRAEMIRVLNPREDGKLACQHTSKLYPSWTFATTPHAPPAVSATATAALLEIPADPMGWTWSVATDFSATDQLMKNLRIGPYEVLRQWSFSHFARRHWREITLAILALFMLSMHSLVVSYLVRRRTEELSDALKREKAMAAEAAEANARIDAMQRAGTVGQIGSMLAHELKQPIAAIRYMARGLRRHLEETPPDLQTLSEAAESIQQEAGRAAGIVERVRGYARAGSSQRCLMDLADAARLAIENFRKSGRYSVPVALTVESPASVLSDPLEAELAVLNLVKNAAEACQSVPGPAVYVTVGTEGEMAFVRVADNGPVVGETDLKRLETPLTSGKPGGLGLGLVIVRSVAEAGGGNLTFAPGVKGGLVARMTLRLAAQGGSHA